MPSPRNAFLLSPEQQMAALHREVADLAQRGLETRRLIPTEASLRPMLLAVYDAECARLETLRDDAVRALSLLVEAGAVSRDALNAAVTPRTWSERVRAAWRTVRG